MKKMLTVLLASILFQYSNLASAGEGYDEVVHPTGGYRGRYHRIMGITNRLSEKQITAFKKAARGRGSDGRELRHLPRILLPSEHDYLKAAINQRGRTLHALLEDLRSGSPKIIERGILSAELVDRLMNKAGTSYEKLRNMENVRTGLYYGPDIVRGPNGEFYVLEDNTGFLGGMADAVESRKDFLELLPQYQEILKDGPGKTFAQVIAETLRQMAGSKDKALVLLTPNHSYEYNHHLIEQLEKVGVYTSTPSGFTVRGQDYDELSIDSSSGEPKLIFLQSGKVIREKSVGAIAIRNYEQAQFKSEYPKTYEAFSKNKVAILGFPFTGFDFLGDKELSIYVEQMVTFYLQEKPLISYLPTESFRSIGPNGETVLKWEMFDRVFSDINQYAVKDTQGMAGREVFLGPRLSSKEIANVKTKIKEEPGEYIAQELIPISTVGDHIVDIRIFSTITKHGVFTSDYFWGRALSIHGDGKLNVSQKGHVIPVFVQGRDTVPYMPKANECMRHLMNSKAETLGR